MGGITFFFCQYSPYFVFSFYFDRKWICFHLYGRGCLFGTNENCFHSYAYLRMEGDEDEGEGGDKEQEGGGDEGDVEKVSAMGGNSFVDTHLTLLFSFSFDREIDMGSDGMGWDPNASWDGTRWHHGMEPHGIMEHKGIK